MKNWVKATPLIWLLLAAPAAAAPTVQEFADGLTANAGLGDIVLGPDGKLWFTEKTINKIGRVTPTDPPLIEEFDVASTFTEPFNITVGPDNMIWFSGKNNNAGGVGRMNPANPADTQGFGGFNVTTPAGIAAGPDGKIWLGDQAGKVVRINPADGAEETLSDIDLTGFNIRNISPGPTGDPNVWVTDFGGKIAKVAPTGPAGVVTPYDVPGDGTWDITVGPDNNLWYTAPEGNNSKIGRITPAGDFGTQFDATDAGDQLGITVGPDGALWFAQAVANNIGRMTLDGNFTTVEGLTAAARPEYIAPGPNNTLWFTEKDGNRIGRITGIEVPGGGGGGGGNPPPPPPDTTKPDVTGLRLTRTRFRLGGALPKVAAVRTGTSIRFTISEAATARLRFRRLAPGRLVGGRCVKPTRLNRSRRRCTRVLPVRGSVALPVQAGARRIRFAGRLSKRRSLKPGRYRLILTARDAAGNVSTPDRVRFRLLRRRG
jgi:virginiamycin B lyase